MGCLKPQTKTRRHGQYALDMLRCGNSFGKAVDWAELLIEQWS
jgi:hypothetical protein